MKYCTVTSSMSKKSVEVDSTNHMCAERQLIRRLYRECIRKGYKPHQFSDWVHRKYGHLIISRNTTSGLNSSTIPRASSALPAAPTTFTSGQYSSRSIFKFSRANSSSSTMRADSFFVIEQAISFAGLYPSQINSIFLSEYASPSLERFFRIKFDTLRLRLECPP